MLSAPKNVSSYETGGKPYNPDASRGKWLSKWDFFAANFGHSFGVKHFSIFPYLIVRHSGILFLIPYIISILTFSIPIYFIQSFMGQFSSSGTISAFRIAPLFKGLGYIILALNLMSASYYAVIAAVPLLYFFGSLNPTMPWMTCGNAWNTVNCTVKFENSTDNYYSMIYDFAGSTSSSTEYFHFAVAQQHHEEEEVWTLSWRVLVCTFIVWVFIGAIVIQGVEMMGKIIRYMVLVIFASLGIVFLRFIFLEGAFLGFGNIFYPKNIFHGTDTWVAAPSVTLIAFGSGWGTVMTMASYNNFDEDIGKYSIIINFVHVGIVIITGLCTSIAEEYLIKVLNFHLHPYGDTALDYIYVGFPYLFGHIGASHLWSLLFFVMLFLGELTACVIQVFTILTAVFDEFEPFRIYKKEFTLLLVLFLSLFSILFSFNVSLICNSYNMYIFHTTPRPQAMIVYLCIYIIYSYCICFSFWVVFYAIDYIISIATLSQIFVCFVELMLVVWVYGRLRFQRDVQFLLGIIYPTWKFYIIRFVTPTLLFLAFVVAFFIGLFNVPREHAMSILVSFCIKISPILILPGYIIYKLQHSSGNFLERFKNLCKPNDWYPVDPDIRQRYEEYAGSSDDIGQNLIGDITKELDDKEDI